MEAGNRIPCNRVPIQSCVCLRSFIHRGSDERVHCFVTLCTHVTSLYRDCHPQLVYCETTTLDEFASFTLNIFRNTDCLRTAFEYLFHFTASVWRWDAAAVIRHCIQAGGNQMLVVECDEWF